MATNDKYGLTYDVIVIGSGVAGALIAHRLAQAPALLPAVAGGRTVMGFDLDLI